MIREPAPPNGSHLARNELPWHSMHLPVTECPRFGGPARWETRNDWEKMPDTNNWTVTIKSFMDKSPLTSSKAHERNGSNTLSLSVSASGLVAAEEFLRNM